jgi:2-amino-4-hydroxy-6-hydroxymethyldihydropteridine diphosphokinase
MTLCYLALGSNLSSPQRQLRRAIKQINTLPGTYLLKVSHLYFSKAWGRKLQPNFYNAVVAVHTRLSPEALLKQCQSIENKQGRQRKVRYGARTLDIDILLYDKKSVVKSDKLIVPHPRLLERDFVLIPLLEIAPLVCMPDGSRVIEARN